MAETASSMPSPVYPRSVSFINRILYAIKLNLMKFLANQFFNVLTLPGIRDSSILPTFTKIYPCRPTLTNRVFIPKSYKSDGNLLPLYLDIHGGGFALMSPKVDDKFCSGFANKHNVIVISLDHPKSPQNPYPAAVHAIIDIVKAILEDEALPIDKKKVAIGGFSAGANLSLAISQDDALQGRIGGVVAFYPPVDLTTPLEVNLATRPKDAGPDPLAKSVHMFNWGYMNPDQNVKDPQLSVTYAPSEKLPPKIAFFGCELDLLCRDAEKMAHRLADERSGQRTGTDDLWEKDGVRWEKILGEEHGFDQTPAVGAKKIRVAKRAQQMYDDAAAWLFREVYV